MNYLRDGDQYWSIEAEAATLGSMLIEPECIPSVAAIITNSEMFFDKKNQLIFEALLTLHIEGRGMDAVMLRTKLKQRKQLKAAGGVDYIGKILDSVPSAANHAYYAGIVRERHIYRNVCIATEKMREIPNQQGEANEFIDQIQEIAMSLERDREDKVYTFKDNAPEAVMSLADQKHSVHTGFADIDKIIGGFFDHELIVVAGRPGMGKSVFAGDVALNAGKEGKRIVMFSMEMSAESLAQRSVCAVGKVNGFAWHNDPPKEEFDAAIEAAAEIQKYDIRIYDTVEAAEKMYSIAHSLKRASGLDLIIIDNLQLIQTSINTAKEYDRLTIISRQLKRIPRNIRVPVMCISHLNREVDKRTNHRPRLSDLRGSGSIEQDADLVIMIHREDQYRRIEEPDLPQSELDGIAEITIAKNRRGKTGICKLLFLEESTHFVNVAKEYLTEGDK